LKLPTLLYSDEVKKSMQTLGDVVTYEVKDRIAYVTLNRPDRLNAINEDMRIGLLASFRSAAANPNVHVVVLRGAGRAFSAGADITTGSGEWKLLEWRQYFMNELELYSTMINLPKIIVAVTHGYVLGVGFWIMNACDAVISTDDCKFGLPELRQRTSGWFMFNPANMPRN
jgi:enoyl-CoA hydratase/carnithine racemase